MNDLETLRQDLWHRWEQSFDRMDELVQVPGTGGQVVYSKLRLFDLKNYTPQQFPAGGRTYRSQPEGTNSVYRYQLDTRGRPMRMSSSHFVNRIGWEGSFRYSESEVEYVEFCLQTRVVSGYARMTLRDGLPRTFQKIDVNGGGSHIGGRTGKAAMERIVQDSYFYWTEVEQYQAAEGRIVAGQAMAEGGRLPARRSTLEYSYSNTGRLERIERTWDDGGKQTLFAAKSALSTAKLTSRLCEKIAARTIAALQKVDLQSPLLAVELSYRSVTNYVPAIIAAIEQEPVSEMRLVLAIPPEKWISLNQQDFEPEMTEFLQRLSSDEDWDSGSKMLRQAARIVTREGPRSFTTADGFVAFAIDWELEGHELPSILKQCGATAATLKKLRSIGWLT